MYSSHHHKHHALRLLCLTALVCFAAGGTAYACTRKAAVPQLGQLRHRSCPSCLPRALRCPPRTARSRAPLPPHRRRRCWTTPV